MKRAKPLIRPPSLRRVLHVTAGQTRPNLLSFKQFHHDTEGCSAAARATGGVRREEPSDWCSPPPTLQPRPRRPAMNSPFEATTPALAAIEAAASENELLKKCVSIKSERPRLLLLLLQRRTQELSMEALKGQKAQSTLLKLYM
ncbi:uncharacterized protein V6R79_022398 [Siganus canaliculatus]